MEGVSEDLKKSFLFYTYARSKEQLNIDDWIHFCPFSPTACRCLVVVISDREGQLVLAYMLVDCAELLLEIS